MFISYAKRCSFFSQLAAAAAAAASRENNNKHSGDNIFDWGSTLKYLASIFIQIFINPLSHELWIMNIFEIFCYFLVHRSLIKKKNDN